MARFENEKTIMSRMELKDKAWGLCYGFDLHNANETQLINSLCDLIYGTFYDTEKNQYKNHIDWSEYHTRISDIKIKYGNKDFNFDLYERIIFKLFINF